MHFEQNFNYAVLVSRMIAFYQGEHVDIIENNVESTAVKVESARNKMQEAVISKKQYRKVRPFFCYAGRQCIIGQCAGFGIC